MADRGNPDTATPDAEQRTTFRSKRDTVVSTRLAARDAARLRDLAGDRSLSDWLHDLVLNRLDGPERSRGPYSPPSTATASTTPISWDCNHPGSTGPTSARLVWLNAPVGTTP